MKKVGTYTCRGTVTPDGAPHQINLFDGSFKTGYIVREFVVAAYDIDNNNVRTFAGKLGTVDSLSAQNWNWADQRELAWAWFTSDSNGVAAPNHFSQIDSDIWYCYTATHTESVVVKVDPTYYRPSEVDLLIGNPGKARKKLGWVPEYDLNGLIEDMMQSDVHLMKKESYLMDGGYKTLNYFE